MIVGNGDIAHALTDNSDITFFASGVSNSRENNPVCFAREYDLLMEQPLDKQLVYFSTLSIFYGSSPYIKHKIFMENTIRERFASFGIVRIGNITWGDNPNTLLNFFTNKIKNNEPFEIRNEYRHLIAKSDLLFWVNLIPKNSKTDMCITGKRITVQEIADRIKNNTLMEYLGS